jgi:hypothetical protein
MVLKLMRIKLWRSDPHTEPSQFNSYFVLIIERKREIAYFLLLLTLHLLAISGEKQIQLHYLQ